MKQYDQIWVPDENGDYKLHEFYEDRHEWVDSHEPLVSRKSNVIVLTIQEAEELWNAGHKRGWAEAFHGEEAAKINFQSYIQSKGIQL